MIIAFDSTPLETGHKDRGVGTYTRLLREALTVHQPEYRLQGFVRGRALPPAADIVHYPYFDPFFLTLPLAKPKPVVVTVHDLIPLAYPQHFPRGIKGELKWQIQRFSLARAAWIITDSEASRKDISRLVGFPRERISVIYLAPAPAFHPAPPTLLPALRKRFDLPGSYLLYVGDVNWNKNIPNLLRAFAEYLAADVGRETVLVLAGKAFQNEALAEVQEIRALVGELGIGDRIRYTGRVTQDELVGLYTFADCYLQLSIAEGFGLPVLEAMACGCPAVVANTSSLTEIAGPAELVDPFHPHDIAMAVRRCVKSHSAADRKRYQSWAATFTWEKVARETLHVYGQVLHN